MVRQCFSQYIVFHFRGKNKGPFPSKGMERMENFRRISRFVVEMVEETGEEGEEGKENCEFFSNPIVFCPQIV